MEHFNEMLCTDTFSEDICEMDYNLLIFKNRITINLVPIDGATTDMQNNYVNPFQTYFISNIFKLPNF